MKSMLIYYRLWLSIIATNIVNLSMIFFSANSKEDVSNNLDSIFYNSYTNKNNENNSEKSISQLEAIRKKNTITVAIVGKKAYWVHDNIFYETDVVDGYIDNSAARPIDAHKLSKKELKDLLDILDQIRA